MKDWKWQLCNSVKTAAQLKTHFSFTNKEKAEIAKILKKNRLSLTPYLLSLIKTDKNSRIVKHDPIWLQYGPSKFEEQRLEAETSWEKEEEMFAGGLGQHKYPDKAVIRIAHHCGAYCRFCYEHSRTLKNAKIANLAKAKKQAVKYIKQHPEIREIILTGGDPLALADDVLEEWIKKFSNIKTIESVRIHTRMPAQNPYRITSKLIDIFKKYSIRWIIIQVNHPRELTDDFISHIKMLQECGIIVKTQNPIIHGVNDNPKTLAEFIRKCRALGIQHHHWFHAMPVTPAPMRTSVERAVLLFQNTQRKLGGIRWNPSELGDLTIDHHSGKRSVPFQEIKIDLSIPREKWGTNKFQFTTDKNNNPIIRFTSWNPNSDEWHEYLDPHIDLNNIEKSDFIDLL